MSLALLIDEDVHLELAEILRTRRIDALHIQELGRKGLSDDAQLSFAVSQERAILSFNVRDYVILHNEYVRKNFTQNGVIVSKHLSLSLALSKVLRLLQTESKESLLNTLRFL
jgi:predicted nuclease of predicted toxin-antitoxin system